ncbi:MAG: DUF4864 domain-containing protein [Gammaproteobacteria bacterium]|nr:MAG: DUF4864 domain-containing protein [Gammaproteobacteria bacterium]UCH39556.1 MAG: DUF4864 domain-containing protein [Gammaproteobacteria bacterium]
MSHRFKYAAIAMALLGWALALPSTAALGEKAKDMTLPRPSVELAPQDVVKIVITALSRNDEPYLNAGIETTFAFASPANKVNTGPLDRFIRMVKGPPYGIMVDHASSEFSEVVLAGNKAYQMVHLTAPDGRAVIFAFRLSKQQDGEFKDMWMTDAVWPVANAMPEQSF